MDLSLKELNLSQDGNGTNHGDQEMLNSSPESSLVENIEMQAGKVCDSCGAPRMAKKRRNLKSRRHAMAAKSVRRNKKKTAASCLPTKRRAATAMRKKAKAAAKKQNKNTC